ncbi:hypothetical protein D5086_031724 [Populus alba]|uniref:Uncharacterized protein n=1 Tax=Populus alba TaxID=43335 RepID=A0ACC4AJF5_POPAL
MISQNGKILTYSPKAIEKTSNTLNIFRSNPDSWHYAGAFRTICFLELFPHELGRLVNLKILILSANYLTGELPRLSLI